MAQCGSLTKTSYLRTKYNVINLPTTQNDFRIKSIIFLLHEFHEIEKISIQLFS